MDTADALHQGRFAGAIVAEQRQDFAAMGLDADALERVNRAETLLGLVDGKQRRRHCALADWSARARASRWLRNTSASTASTMMRPMAIIWKKTSTPRRLSALRM